MHLLLFSSVFSNHPTPCKTWNPTRIRLSNFAALIEHLSNLTYSSLLALTFILPYPLRICTYYNTLAPSRLLYPMQNIQHYSDTLLALCSSIAGPWPFSDPIVTSRISILPNPVVRKHGRHYLLPPLCLCCYSANSCIKPEYCEFFNCPLPGFPILNGAVPTKSKLYCLR